MRDTLSTFINRRRRTVLAYISSLTILMSGFVVIFIVNNWSGVDVYGQFSLIVASTSLVTKFLSSRTSEAIVKFYIKNALDDNKNLMQQTILISFIIDMISSVAIYLIINYFSDTMSDSLLKSEMNYEIWLYSLVVVMGFMKSSFIGYLQSKKQLNKISIVNALEAALKILFLYLVFVYLDSSLESLILSVLMSTVISFLAFLIFSIRYLREDGMFFKPSFDMAFIKDYFKFTTTTFMSSTLKGINQGGDIIILGLFTNPTIVGVYDSLKKIANISTFPAIVMPFLYASKISEWSGESRYKKIKSTIIKTTSKLLLVSLSIACFILFVGPYILKYFSIDESYYSLLIILICSSLVNVSVWWGRIYSNIMNPFISLYVNVFISIFLLICSTSMVYFWGLEGMASSIAIMNVGVLYLFIKLSRIKG